MIGEGCRWLCDKGGRVRGEQRDLRRIRSQTRETACEWTLARAGAGTGGRADRASAAESARERSSSVDSPGAGARSSDVPAGCCLVRGRCQLSGYHQPRPPTLLRPRQSLLSFLRPPSLTSPPPYTPISPRPPLRDDPAPFAQQVRSLPWLSVPFPASLPGPPTLH